MFFGNQMNFPQQPFQFAPMQQMPGAGMQAQMTMVMMTALMGMMMQLMEGMMGQIPMPGSGGFGQPGGSFMGGSPVGNFLGTGGGGMPMGGASGGGGAFAPTGSGAHLGPADGSVTPSTQNFINESLKLQGTPYVFGATGPNKFDCSGLVHYVLNKSGVPGRRETARGYQNKYRDHAVTRDQLKPGDLVFFHSANNRGIPKGQATHVEIYLGNGKSMGTTPSKGGAVKDMNWNSFIGGARVPELNR